MYNVYKNQELNPAPVGTTVSPKKWVKENIFSTHMGEWRKFKNGDLEYATTIGEYYKFEKIKN